MSIVTLGPIFNSQNGKTREWSISLSLFDHQGNTIHAAGRAVEDINMQNGYYASYTTCSGYTGMKMTTSAPTLVKVGKNLGGKNATNVLTQSFKDCQSKYESKMKAGYTVEAAVPQSSALPFPMAVKTWRDRGDKLVYPLFVQPKLDGVRMLAHLNSDGVVHLATRRLHYISGFETMKEALSKMFGASRLKTLIIDGELYSHGANLQTISGIVRNISMSETEKEKLQFHVFDCFDVNKPQMSFKERHALLETFVLSAESKFIQLTETKRVDTPSEANLFFMKTIAKGYEGIIYKSADRTYEFSFNKERRSAWYLKRKRQDDAEYAIVAFTEGKGKDTGCVVFVLETADGKRFNCVPNGTYEYRKRLYEQSVNDFAGRFKGKLAKVQFDDLSKDGVPLRGRIVHIERDYNFE